MAEAMRGALSLTLSGFGFASHDIGGFEVNVYLSPPIDFLPFTFVLCLFRVIHLLRYIIAGLRSAFSLLIHDYTARLRTESLGFMARTPLECWQNSLKESID